MHGDSGVSDASAHTVVLRVPYGFRRTQRAARLLTEGWRQLNADARGKSRHRGRKQEVARPTADVGKTWLSARLPPPSAHRMGGKAQKIGDGQLAVQEGRWTLAFGAQIEATLRHVLVHAASALVDRAVRK